MKNELVVQLHFGEKTIVKCMDIVPPFIELYKGVDVCDDGLIAAIAKAYTSGSFRIVAKQRKDYFNLLSKQIAEQIMLCVEAQDTYNGYPVEKDNERIPR